jgi:hypothetical protein
MVPHPGGLFFAPPQNERAQQDKRGHDGLESDAIQLNWIGLQLIV